MYVCPNDAKTFPKNDTLSPVHNTRGLFRYSWEEIRKEDETDAAKKDKKFAEYLSQYE